MQARDYTRKNGVGFAIVTNGSAWIIFPVNRRDLVSFEESTAIIFKDADSALSKDVDEFKALLSRGAIINGALDAALLGGDCIGLIALSQSLRVYKLFATVFVQP